MLRLKRSFAHTHIWHFTAFYPDSTEIAVAIICQMKENNFKKMELGEISQVAR